MFASSFQFPKRFSRACDRCLFTCDFDRLRNHDSGSNSVNRISYSYSCLLHSTKSFICHTFFSSVFNLGFECVCCLDKKLVPKSASDIKLINAGKILENGKTVAQCKAPFDDLPKSVITMHVVVQPSPTKARPGLVLYTDFYLCKFLFLKDKQNS